MNELTTDPFIETIHEIFDSMIGSPVTVEASQRITSVPHSPDLIGVIGLSGSAQGMVALRMPEKSACAIIGQMVGAQFDEVTSEIVDGVGELVNMVAGSAKARFKGHSISISIPTVVCGDICRLSSSSDTMWTEFRLKTELGDFWLIVSLKAVKPVLQEVASEGTCR